MISSSALAHGLRSEMRQPFVVRNLPFVPACLAERRDMRHQQHACRKRARACGSTSADVIRRGIGLLLEERPALFFAHAGKLCDQAIIVHHHQRPFVIPQPGIGPTIVAHQADVWRQLDDAAPPEPDEPRVALA